MAAAVRRVRDRATFAALRQHGYRVRSGALSVIWLPGPEQPPRVAFAIGRSIGTAVTRNRLRRRLRHLAAEHTFDRPGAYLIGASPAAAHLDYGDLRRNLSTALAQLP